MVTAGVYLIARFQPVFQHAPIAAGVAAGIGVATAAMAALVACVQTDIKRVLAYSTMSQVGYMFFGVAIGAVGAGMFHLVTHAFFKALLFLAAGNIIHALAGEQDLRKMGGLWERLPVTRWLFLIGTLALAGVPPLAGFFSKDEIIAAGLARGPLLRIGGLVLILVAGVTAFYMLRAFYLAFFAARESPSAAHDAPPVMVYPVAILALFSAIGGLLQFRPFWQLVDDFLGTSAGAESRISGTATALTVITTTVLVLAGLMLASRHFSAPGARDRVRGIEARGDLVGHAFYWDALYERLVVQPLWALGAVLDRVVEQPVVIGAVDASAALATGAARAGRRLQNGYVRSYAFVFMAAVLLSVVGLGLSLR
jgi:NADH-quinone oxidoreductase subunit L